MLLCRLQIIMMFCLYRVGFGAEQIARWLAERADVQVVQCTFASFDFLIVLCEYSKFRIESNSYFSICFDSKFSHTYSHKFLYLFNRMTPIFHLSNHA